MRRLALPAPLPLPALHVYVNSCVSDIEAHTDYWWCPGFGWVMMDERVKAASVGQKDL